MKRKNRIRERWERVDGRKVRIWAVYPENPVWPDPDVYPPYWLLHGLGCSVEAWDRTLQYFARCGISRPAYAMDMPGYGRSPGPRHTLGMDELADWSVQLMDLLGIPRAHLAGNSLGCQVALAMARQHPDRVGAVVLGGPTEGADVVPLWRMTVGLVADGVIEPFHYNLRLARMYAQMGIPRYLATVKKMAEDDPVRDATQVKAPCLIVRGSRDAIVPKRGARALADALPRGAFASVEGAAHAVQYNSPEPFARHALDFWTAHEPWRDAP